MTKIHTTVTIDPDLLRKAKSIGINISGSLQEYLEKLVMQNEDDLDGVNLELLNIEVVRLQNELTRTQIMLSSKLKLKETIEQKREKDKEEELIREKQAIEDAKKCIGCSTVLEDGNKRHEFTKGLVCNACYFGASKSKIAEWMKLG